MKFIQPFKGMKPPIVCPKFLKLQGFYGCLGKCKYCLAENTQISTMNGKKYVRDVKVGDEVLAFDGVSISKTRVMRISKRLVLPNEILVLVLENGQKIYVTQEHPFYVRGTWIEAGQLSINDELFFFNPSEIISFHKRQNNPMNNIATQKKMGKTRSRLYGNALSIGIKEMRRLGVMMQRPPPLSLEVRQKMSERMKKDNPMADPKTVRKVQRHPNVKKYHRSGGGFNIRWKKVGERKKQSDKMKANNPMKDANIKLKSFLGHERRPSSLEERVIRIVERFGLPLTYTGDGIRWIGAEGGQYRNPDFVVRGEKKVVEAWNPRWPPREAEYEQRVKAFYEACGFKALPLKVENTRSDEDIGKELRNFTSNGLKIVEIRGLRSNELTNLGKRKGGNDRGYIQLNRRKANESISVYNLHCKPYNNFLIRGVLAHNCYLRATYIRQCGGEVPRPTLYENTGPDMLLKEFQRFCKKETTPQLLNTGELSDSFGMEDNWYPGAGPFSQFIIEMFRKQNTHKVLFLTKLSIIQNVLKLPPTDQVIFSFSFNAPSVVENCGEPNNLAWRIQCSKKLKNLGWHVRGRIDPILPFMLDTYRDLIPQLTHLERITLGSLRINNRLLPKTYPTFWQELIPKMHDIAPGVYRFPIEEDCMAFKTIIGWLHDAGFTGELGLCKEHWAVWEELNLDWKHPLCNCIL